MKNVLNFALGVFLVSIISCSNDETVNADTSVSKENQLFERLASDVYPEYSKLLEDLYGNEYDVKDESSYYDNGDEFIVHEVYSDKGGDNKLVGYFVKDNLNKVAYLAFHEDLGSLDYYELTKSGDYNLRTFDLTQDSKYLAIGFSPVTPQPEVLGRRKFWGSVKTVTEQDAGNGWCVTHTVTTHYVFWIASGQPVHNFSEAHPCSN